MAALHLPWVEGVRGRLGDLDLLPLLALTPGAEGYLPDFVTPPPTSPLMRIEDELELIQSTPARQVQKELTIFEEQHGGLPAPAEPLRADPRRELPKLVSTMREYWRRALEPHWPRVLALLSADLRHRATQLTEGGAAALFADLHPTITFEGEWIHVDQAWQGTVLLDGRGLLLMPTVFNWARPSVIAVTPWQPTLVYPARGVALLWQEADEGPPELARLLGASRARILAALGAPQSTSELAERLGLTPGGVSQHLAVLAAAHLVSRQRDGRVVLYARTALGDALLEGQEASASTVSDSKKSHSSATLPSGSAK